MRKTKLIETLELYGGIASRRELVRAGCYEPGIDIATQYGGIIRVRKGWYALRDTHPDVLRAWRVGGRLACVSALAYYGLGEHPERDASRDIHDSGAIHVYLPRQASRLRMPATGEVVLHWSRRTPPGIRAVVPRNLAFFQAENCRALEQPIGGPGPARIGRTRAA